VARDARGHAAPAVPAPPIPGPAKRFAQTIGALFTLVATGIYVAGFHVEAYALVGVIALFASLEAGLGLCVGCKAFFLGMRLGIVPPSVCEECAPYVRRGAA